MPDTTVLVCRDPDALAAQAVALILESAPKPSLVKDDLPSLCRAVETPERTYTLLAKPENARRAGLDQGLVVHG